MVLQLGLCFLVVVYAGAIATLVLFVVLLPDVSRGPRDDINRRILHSGCQDQRERDSRTSPWVKSYLKPLQRNIRPGDRG